MANGITDEGLAVLLAKTAFRYPTLGKVEVLTATQRTAIGSNDLDPHITFAGGVNKETLACEHKDARLQQALQVPPPVPGTEQPAPVVKEPIFGDDATEAPASK